MKEKRMVPFLLVNQMKMPIVGLGTYKLGGQETLGLLDHCLKIGYRVFDTAQGYRNEADIGDSLQTLLPKYNLKREDIFIITKIAPENHGEKCEQSVLASLEKLKSSYIDLILIHWPGFKGLKPDDKRNTEMRKQTWQVLESLNQSGLVKSIGVSNYTIRHLNELLSHAIIKPHLLQSEYHPLLVQDDLVKFCRQNSIVFQAYSSLGTSDPKSSKLLTENETIVSIAKKYSKTPAQILLKFSVQQNISVIPKSRNPKHIEENINLFDFEIDENDMNSIRSLNENNHLCWDSAKVC